MNAMFFKSTTGNPDVSFNIVFSVVQHTILPGILLVSIHVIRLTTFRTTLLLQRSMLLQASTTDELRATAERETRTADELRATADKLHTATADNEKLQTNTADKLRVNADKLRDSLADAEKMAYRAAHDFGTPLAALVLMMDYLKIKYGDDPMVKNLIAAVSSLVRLRNLMMDESRVTMGETLQPRRETINPQEMLEEIGRIGKSTAQASGVAFDLVVLKESATSSEDELCVNFDKLEEIALLPILADGNRMVNVAINFVSNAVKHAKKRVEMVIPVPNDERGFRIEVHDDGGGVPAEIAPVLFGPIMGAVQRAMTHDGGNGVGLWSVKKMCECVGGNCGFGKSSRLGGAMFWFWFPYVPDLLAAHSPATLSRILIRVPPHGGDGEDGEDGDSGSSKGARRSPSLKAALATKPLNILVCDDSPSIRFSIKAVLERCGHTVTLAENGRDGLDAMKNRQWEFVLSDVQMPMKDGFEMTRLLREWEAEHRPGWRQPLVLMSANISEDERPRVRFVTNRGVCVCVCVCVCALCLCARVDSCCSSLTTDNRAQEVKLIHLRPSHAEYP